MHTSDSATGSTDEYETDHHYPSDDDVGNAKFLRGGRLSRSPDRVAARRSPNRRTSPRKTSPRRGASRCSAASASKGGGGNSSMAGTSKASSKRTPKRASSDASYAGDDSDGDSEMESQKYKVDTRVVKKFEDGQWYAGKVTRYFLRDKLYQVTYDDGDMEEYDEKEMNLLVENAKKRRGENANSNAKRESSNSDDESIKNEDDTGVNISKKNAESASDSEDSDDSDEDPFSHLGKSNRNKRKIVYSDSDSDSDISTTAPARGKSNKKSEIDSDSDNSIYLTRNRPPSKKPTSDLDSDSDSSIEIIDQNQKKPTRSSPSRSTSNRSNSTSSPKKNISNSNTLNPSVRAQSKGTLEKSRAALVNLKNAQKYHAEELEEKLPPPSRQSIESIDVDDSSVEAMYSKPAAMAAAATPAAYAGSLMKLTIRYKDFTNKSKDVRLRIRSDEPLKFLNDKFQGGSILSLEFDGRKLDMNHTPQFYEMEDEDLLDAVVSSASRTVASNVIKLVVRRTGTTYSHEFGLRVNDSLSKLISAVSDKFKVPSVVLQYNGRKLDPSKSCQAEGITSNATIDAIAAKTISLEFRVNGDSNDVYRINALEKGSFKHAMEAFCQKKKCSLADCKFLFDGDLLQPMTSMESLDLEGDEIIDVKLNVAAVVAANPLPLQDADGDVVMADAPAAIISVRTVRNVSSSLCFSHCDSSRISKPMLYSNLYV